MKLYTPLALLFVLSLGTSAVAADESAAATGPLGAMNYFAGSWNCTGGMLGKPAGKAVVSFELELGSIYQESVDVAAMDKQPAYHFLGSVAYDAKKHRLIGAGIDQMGSWGVSWTAGWVGNVLTWRDIVTADGDLGREVITKSGAATYDDVGYAKVSGVEKAVFKAHCIKAASS